MYIFARTREFIRDEEEKREGRRVLQRNGEDRDMGVGKELGGE